MPDPVEYAGMLLWAAVCGIWLAWGVKLWAEFFKRYMED